jgi:coenzyme F420-0:L-glutamate ligase/coenzyme F420-1:gamma-L-glutamate ligase
VRDKAGREGVVVVRGLERYVTAADGPGAAALIRPPEEDLFR